jgi:membrane protease YdiL (CAAX protease family)
MRSPTTRLGYFVVGASVSLVLSIFVAGLAVGPNAISSRSGLVLTNLVFVVSLVALSRLLLHWEGATLRELGLLLPARARGREFAFGFVVSSVLFMTAAVAQAVAVGAPLVFQGMPGIRAAVLGIGISTVLALSEELLFRGVALRYLRASYGDRGAIVLSALLFGAYHLVQSGDWAMGAVFRLGMPILGGLLFGWAAVRSGGLALPLGLHVGGNWVQSALAGFTPAATAVTEPVSALWRIPITVDDFRRLTAPDLLPHLPYLIALTLAAVITWRMVAKLSQGIESDEQCAPL